MRTPLLGAATVAVLAAGALATTGVLGSSHREAPRIMLDPSADNTDLYAFTAPDAPGKLTVVSNWVPLQNPAGGPYFGKLDPDGALLRQDRQHRRRRRGRRLSLAVPQPLPEPELVPVRGPAGQLDRRPEPQLRPDLRPLLRALPQRARSSTRERIAQRRAGRARQRRARRRCPNYARGRRPARSATCRAAARRSSARSTTRSSSTSARSSTASTSTSPAARRSGSATRAAARTTSPASTSTRSCCRCRQSEVTRDGKRRLGAEGRERRRRRLVDHRAPARSRSRAASAQERLGAGQPPRQPADQRGRSSRSARRTSTTRRRPTDDLKNFGADALSPEPARDPQRAVRPRHQGEQPHGHRPGAADRHPRPDADLAQRRARRHAEDQPRRAADREPEPLRRAGR